MTVNSALSVVSIGGASLVQLSQQPIVYQLTTKILFVLYVYNKGSVLGLLGCMEFPLEDTRNGFSTWQLKFEVNMRMPEHHASHNA